MHMAETHKMLKIIYILKNDWRGKYNNVNPIAATFTSIVRNKLKNSALITVIVNTISFYP